MKYHFLLLYDKLFEFGAPAYDEIQISSILTDAQLRVATRNEQLFERSEKKRRNLEQFIKTGSISEGDVAVSASQVGAHVNGTYLDLPADFLLAVEESVEIGTLGAEEIVRVKPVQYDFYLKNVNNPYKKPNLETGTEVVWRMDVSRQTHAVGTTSATPKRTEIITEGTDFIDYIVSYLITPPDILVDTITPANQVHSILDDTLHYEIVREAVKIASGATQPENYQITDKESKENQS